MIFPNSILLYEAKIHNSIFSFVIYTLASLKRVSIQHLELQIYSLSNGFVVSHKYLNEYLFLNYGYVKVNIRHVSRSIRRVSGSNTNTPPMKYLCFLAPPSPLFFILCFSKLWWSMLWFFRFLTFTWQLLAMSAASFSTLYYIILQFFHVLLSYGSQSYIYIVSERLFSYTWKNIQIRSCQILYWSIFLRNTGVR